MNGTLKLISNTLAYADLGNTSNPSKKYVDWSVQRTYAVQNPKAEPYTVDPGTTINLFSGLRSTTVGSGTEFAVTLSPLAPTTYRFTWDTVGANPTLRTDRGLALATRAVAVVANANLTVTITSTAGDFTTVQTGDTVFIPDTMTGDAPSCFNPINTGYWVVLAIATDGSSIQLARPPGLSFSGISENVTIASSSQLSAYSSAGVQVGDKVNITAGFAPSLLNTYSITAVTSTWFEVFASQPLPVGVTGVPGTAGIQFFTGSKRYIRFEADQECTLRLNGDTGNSNRLSPFTAGDADATGFYEKCGPCWSATVVNLSSVPLNLLFISAE